MIDKNKNLLMSYETSNKTSSLYHRPINLNKQFCSVLFTRKCIYCTDSKYTEEKTIVHLSYQLCAQRNKHNTNKNNEKFYTFPRDTNRSTLLLLQTGK